MGENGAGKSTLMKILYGMQRPDEGEILVDGAPVTIHSPQQAIRAGIGMVHQHFMLADNFTVLENVVLGAEKLAGIGAAARDKIKAISDQYGLGVEPDELMADLGVGDRQRVEILKVLYRGARIVILDEPTAVLVPQEVEELFGNLRELTREGLTVIFISHKLDEVLSVADAITVIRRGTTVATVDPKSVTARDLATLMVGSELPSPEARESTVTDDAGAGGGRAHGARASTAGPSSRTSPSPSTRERCSASPAWRATARPSSSRRSWACAPSTGAVELDGVAVDRVGHPAPPRGRRRLHPGGPAPARPAARRAAVGEPDARPPDRAAQRQGLRARHQRRAGRHRKDRRASTTCARPAST